MSLRPALVLAVLVLALSVPGPSSAQPWPQPGDGFPPPYGRGPSHDSREERKREQQWRKEERKREQERLKQERRDARHWYDDRWREHNRRYFNGYVIRPYPRESYESFVNRVRQRCNVEWRRCDAYCNKIRDPRARAACLSRCNAELYECTYGF